MTNTPPIDVFIGVDTHKEVTLPLRSAGSVLPCHHHCSGQQQGLRRARSLGEVDGRGPGVRHRGHRVLWCWPVPVPARAGTYSCRGEPANRQLRYQQGQKRRGEMPKVPRAPCWLARRPDRPKSGTGTLEMIRHLKIARDTAVKARTQAMQTLKAIIVCSPDALREQLDQVRGKMTLVRRLAALRPGPLTSMLASAKTTLRAIARRWLLLDAEIKQHNAHLETLTAPARPIYCRPTGWPRAPRPKCCCSSATTRNASARRQHSPSCAAPARSRHQAAKPCGTA